MTIDGALLAAGGDAARLLEPVDRVFDPVAPTIGRAVKAGIAGLAPDAQKWSILC
jgi:hypothetical protein